MYAIYAHIDPSNHPNVYIYIYMAVPWSVWGNGSATIADLADESLLPRRGPQLAL